MRTPLSLHPEGKIAFDGLIAELKPSVRESQPTVRSSAPQFSATHRPFVTVNLSSLYSYSYGESRFDENGFELERHKQIDGKLVGLDEHSFAKFREVIVKLSTRPEVRDSLSVEFVDRTLFDWIVWRFADDTSLPSSPTEYLLAKADEEVFARKIMIPIAHLHIQSPFRLGHAAFEFLSKEFWDDYESKVRTKHPGPEESLVKLIEGLRRKYQGVVVSTIEATAEFEKAVQVAITETDKALMALRAFSPSVFLLRIPSYVEKTGHASIPITHVISSDNTGISITTRIEEKREFEWALSDRELELARRAGLDAAHELIARGPQNELEEALLAALSLFSKSITAREYHDRLVFLLASLETMLLKDSSEPIQASLAPRFAFLAETSPDARIDALRLVRDAYEKRSKYLHHGVFAPSFEKREDLEMINRLQYRVWFILSRLLRAKLTSRAALADHIQREMFT